jgi:hypothetical protein
LPCRLNNEYSALLKSGLLTFQSILATYKVALGVEIAVDAVMVVEQCSLR